MRGTHAVSCLAVLALFAIPNSGCALKSLKEANQRLKESNDRLISENNRLEKELAALQEDLARSRTAVSAPAKPEPVVNADPAPGPSAEILPTIPDEPSVTTSRVDGGVRFQIPDRVFFALGQAKLSTRGQNVLNQVGRILKERYPGQMVRVDGHTDDIPVRKVRHLYPSNWELSTARACTVVRYLVENVGISPERVFPAGFAYYKPAATGTSAEARAKNRRVEILVLDRP